MYVLGIVVHTFDPRTWKERQVDLCDFQNSQICIVRSYLKKTKSACVCVCVSVCLCLCGYLYVCAPVLSEAIRRNLLELHLKLLDVGVKNQAWIFTRAAKSHL